MQQEAESKSLEEGIIGKANQENKLSKVIGLLKNSSEHFKHMVNGEEEIRKLLDDSAFNNALGCVYGAFIGDALGSYC